MLAIFPCYHCDQRYSGEAQNLYLSWFDKDEAVKLRYVICPDCRDELMDHWKSRALVRGTRGWAEQPEAFPGWNALKTPQEDRQSLPWDRRAS